MPKIAAAGDLASVVGDRQAFWTIASRDADRAISDPLGFDAMELQLADYLVPCLTGRTKDSRLVFWALVLIGWASDATSDQGRSHRFLCYERVLKLWWARCPRNPRRPWVPDTYSGITRARQQQAWEGEPQVDRLAPLLRQQRAQGLLGVHLGPLRKVGLVQKDQLTLTTLGKEHLNGISERLQFRAGSWTSLGSALDQVDEERRLPAFRRSYADLLHANMPVLAEAMGQLGRGLRPDHPRWDSIAGDMGTLASVAHLAATFPVWATAVRQWFIAAVTEGIPDESLPPFPPLVRASRIDAFDRLRAIGTSGWRRRGAVALTMLARLHHATIAGRGLDPDMCWIDRDGSTPHAERASDAVAEVNDCRWGNAVHLMFPRRSK